MCWMILILPQKIDFQSSLKQPMVMSLWVVYNNPSRHFQPMKTKNEGMSVMSIGGFPLEKGISIETNVGAESLNARLI